MFKKTVAIAAIAAWGMTSAQAAMLTDISGSVFVDKGSGLFTLTLIGFSRHFSLVKYKLSFNRAAHAVAAVSYFAFRGWRRERSQTKIYISGSLPLTPRRGKSPL